MEILDERDAAGRIIRVVSWDEANVKALQAAVEALSREFQLLRVGVEADQDGTLVYVDVGRPAARIEESADLPSTLAHVTSNRRLFDNETSTRFILTGGPRRVLVVATRHSVADGRTVNAVVRALAAGKVLNGGSTRTIGPSIETLLQRHVFADADRRTSALEAMLERAVDEYAAKPPVKLPTASGASDVEVTLDTMPADRTKQLRQRCRVQEISLSSAFAAAFLTELHISYVAPGFHYVATTFDLRRFIPAATNLGVYMGGFRSGHAVAASNELWTLAAEIEAEKKLRSGLGDQLLSVYVQRDAVDYAGASDDTLASVTVSNLGHVDTGRWRPAVFGGGVPPLGRRPGLYVQVAGIGDTLYVSALVRRSLANVLPPLSTVLGNALEKLGR
jgi:hypothetical protein